MSGDVGSGLVARGISKTFGATKALDDVSFSVLPGEIHALLGENGAGKSTLVKIVTGSIKADQGSIEMDGAAFEPNPRFSAQRGLVVVHQELSLLSNLTVAENISLSQIPIRQGALAHMIGYVDRRSMLKRAKAALELMALDINPLTLVSDLSQAERQLVEIARAQAQSPKIILLDEPTSSLPPDQRGALFRRMERIRDSGVGIVFITHSLEEAQKLSDRITVLRDGRNVSTIKASKATVSQLIEFMSGRPPGMFFPQWQSKSVVVAPRLTVQAISSGPKVHNVSLTVRKGEIVGLAGLVGSGRTETLKAVFGASKIETGTILIDGERAHFLSPADAISAGFAFIPENRHEESLFPNHSVMDNICVAAVSSGLENGFRRGRRFVNRVRMAKVAEKFRAVLQIKAKSVHSPIGSLSGGNQQKTILGRWMATKSQDHTRGRADAWNFDRQQDRNI